MAIGDTVLDYRPEFGETWEGCDARLAAIRAGGDDPSALLVSVARKFPILFKGAGWPEDRVEVSEERMAEISMAVETAISEIRASRGLRQ